MIKPSNCLAVIKDRRIFSPTITFAAATATLDPLFVDWDHRWQVVDISVLITTAYIVNQAVTVNVGYVGANTYYLNAATLGAAAVAAGARIPLFSAPGATPLSELPAGNALTAGWTQNAAQTGKGILVITLRPQDPLFKSSKRPGGAAQATT